jgi:hypothetical protein
VDPAHVAGVLLGQLVLIALGFLVLFFVVRAAVVSALLRVGLGTRPSRAPVRSDIGAERAERDAERQPGQ